MRNSPIHMDNIANFYTTSQVWLLNNQVIILHIEDGKRGPLTAKLAHSGNRGTQRREILSVGAYNPTGISLRHRDRIPGVIILAHAATA